MIVCVEAIKAGRVGGAKEGEVGLHVFHKSWEQPLEQQFPRRWIYRGGGSGWHVWEKALGLCLGR